MATPWAEPHKIPAPAFAPLRNPAWFCAHLPEPLDNVVGHAPAFKKLIVFWCFPSSDQRSSVQGASVGRVPGKLRKLLSRLASRPHLACSSVLRHCPGWMPHFLCPRHGQETPGVTLVPAPASSLAPCSMVGSPEYECFVPLVKFPHKKQLGGRGL